MFSQDPFAIDLQLRQPQRHLEPAMDEDKEPLLDVSRVHDSDVHHELFRSEQRNGLVSSSAFGNYVVAPDVRAESAAQGVNRFDSLSPTSHELAAKSCGFEPDERILDPLTAVGYQFVDDKGVGAANPLGQGHTTDFYSFPSGMRRTPQPSLEYLAAMGLVQRQFESGYDMRLTDSSNCQPSYLLTQSLGGEELFPHQNSSKTILGDAELGYSTKTPADDAVRNALHHELESANPGFSDINRPTEETHTWQYGSRGATKSKVSVFEQHQQRSLSNTVQTPSIHASASQSSHDVSAGLSSSTHFPKLNDNFLMPQIEEIPSSASSTEGYAPSLTRSSDNVTSPEQRLPNSFTSLVPLTTDPSSLFSRQTSQIDNLLEDAAVCPYCEDFASRATRRRDRISNLKRHIRDTHEGGSRPTCPEPGCGKTFKRSDYVLRHQRRSHGL